jgi:hypothetical protein
MHLGLINRPFVPHIISYQGSPAALLKLQMAPRFKLLISSGSKKKDPRYLHLGAARVALHYFNTLFINGTTLGEKNVFEHKMCALTLQQLLCETFLILRGIELDMIKNEYRSASCKVPGILGGF